MYDSSANLEGESVLIDDLSDQMITISPYGRRRRRQPEVGLISQEWSMGSPSDWQA